VIVRPARALMLLSAAVVTIAAVAFLRVSESPQRGLSYALLPPGVSYHEDEDFKMFLVKSGGDVSAFRATSPHLGEPLWWCPNEEFFISPSHGELFDIHGRWVAGPSPAGMTPLPALVVNGVVKFGPPRATGLPKSEGGVVSRAALTAYERAISSDYPGSWADKEFCIHHVP
jgi:Rieske Fe-S protein